MSLTRTLTSVGAITIGLAVSGCGGGSDVLTRAEYASQANAICAPAIEAMDAEVIPVVTEMAHDIGEDDADPVRLQDLYAALIEPAAAARETASDMLRELRDLNAPSDIRDDVVGLWTDIGSVGPLGDR